ncbi:D-lactate dehydrogenase [Nostoc sp. 3335mG]|nr:D-lactate dehydrogenase [Nostoc sp. 3335mG]
MPRPASPPPSLVTGLAAICGSRHVLTDPADMAPYCTGFRYGAGSAAAVVLPGSLVDYWRVAQTVLRAGAVLISQAANTGLTGGSTPHGDDYGRAVVVVNTARLKGIHLLGDGRQVLCLAGATLFELEARLGAIGREPHSVIGSSCIGASVIGGVCNNSGGALVKRGPAYTELALYGALGEDGALRLVNELGIALDPDPEAALGQLDRGEIPPDAIDWPMDRRASDRDYASHVRDIDSPGAARFNADPRCLQGASGSAGRLVVFAVRLDSFPQEQDTRTFYAGTNDPAAFTRLRRAILSGGSELPIAAEYLHRSAFDIAARYGKDMYLALDWLGTARLPRLFAAKRWIDRIGSRLGLRAGLSDRIAQRATALIPSPLPRRLHQWRDRFEHHLMIKVSGHGAEPLRRHLAVLGQEGGDWFECTAKEGAAAFQHRFAAAGAAVRYREVHAESVSDIVALDIALPRNDSDWFETLPPEIAADIVQPLYYGHFLCHVFHHDYLVRKGADPEAVKARMLALLDARGAQYPAEHNFGHLYAAPDSLAAHYRRLDPANQLNPGIGKTSKRAGWA